MDNTNVIENTKRIIKQKGLKNCAVAEKAGLSVQQFSNLLHKRKMIRADDVIAIANALEVTPNELFGV